MGHGLMLMTWKPTPVPDAQCFGAMKTSLEHGVNFFNSATFYGINPPEANLDLLSRFFAQYPEYTSRVFLSVKSASPSSEMSLRASLENTHDHLGEGKKIDLFQCARVDRNVPVEETMRILEKLRAEGLFDHIGMSECSAGTLRRACKVAQVAVVEIEVSFAYEEETKAVIAAAKELNVTVAAYLPLGSGFLTGQIKTLADLEAGDVRHGLDKWSKDNFDANLRLAEALKEIAQKKGITPAQLCIAWVGSLGEHVMPIPGSSHPKRTLENLEAANIALSKEVEAIEKAMAGNPVQGYRYSMDHPVWG